MRERTSCRGGDLRHQTALQRTVFRNVWHPKTAACDSIDRTASFEKTFALRRKPNWTTNLQLSQVENHRFD